MAISSDDFLWLLKTLQKLDFFAGFTLEEMNWLTDTMEFREFKKGQDLFRVGDPPSFFGILREGKLVVWTPVLSFLKKKIAVLEPGSFFGEMSLMKGTPHSSALTAAEPSKVYVLYKSGLEHLLKKNPQLASRLKEEAERRDADRRWKLGRA